MQAGGITLKGPSITVRMKLCRDQGDASLRTSADDTSDTNKHDDLRIN
jgi:hypothetical protein